MARMQKERFNIRAVERSVNAIVEMYAAKVTSMRSNRMSSS
jgi:hypothetical protein